MRLTLNYLKERALSRLGVCLMLGISVWLTAWSFQTSLLQNTQSNKNRGAEEKTEQDSIVPAQKQPKPVPRRFFKEVVSNKET